MTETFQTGFNFNRHAYIMQPAGAQKQGIQPNSALTQNPKEVKSKNEMLMYTLGGLAVLGTAGAIIKSQLSSRNNAADPHNANILEIIKLKTRIKDKFTEKRAPIVNRLFEELAAFNPDYKFNTIGQVNAMKMQMDAENKALKSQIVTHKSEKLNVLKNKINSLSSDAEWQDLRKLRKNCIKIYNSNASAAEKQIAEKKIIIINDLLINKAYPEEVEAFEQLYKMTHSDALEFVKKDYKTLNDYNEAFRAAQKSDIPYGIPVRDRNFTSIKPLKLRDVFPDEVLACEECDSELKYRNLKTERLDKIINNYKDDVRKLAEDFRNSVDVKSLKTEIKLLRR